jgi:hypothetical protein
LVLSTNDILELAAAGLTSEQMAIVMRLLARAVQPLEAQMAAAAARTARYRARGGGNISPELRSEVYQRDGFVCVYCGATEDLTCDHVTPVSNGGPTTLENLATACRPCNSRKRDKERKYAARHPDIGRTSDGHARDVEINNKLPEDNKKTNPPLSPPASSNPTEPPEFAEFWEAYPTRHGPRDRKAAVKAFRAALKRDTFAALMEGAKTYHNQLLKANKLNTEFVKQARTWLNNDCWKEAATTRVNGSGSITGRTRHDPLPGETRQEWLARTRSM